METTYNYSMQCSNVLCQDQSHHTNMPFIYLTSSIHLNIHHSVDCIVVLLVTNFHKKTTSGHPSCVLGSGLIESRYQHDYRWWRCWPAIALLIPKCTLLGYIAIYVNHNRIYNDFYTKCVHTQWYIRYIYVFIIHIYKYLYTALVVV